MAEGKRMVDPGGKRMTSPRSQKTRWPPRSVLNSLQLVTAHCPQKGLPGSVCGWVMTVGPKLTVMVHVSQRSQVKQTKEESLEKAKF